MNPIKRLWRVMHRHVTHNRFYPDFRQFTEAIMDFFSTKRFPENRGGGGGGTAETVIDSFRVITHDEYSFVG